MDTNPTAIKPRELRIDLVLEPADTQATVLAVEVQLAPDENKRWSWPAYVANKRHQLRRNVQLVILTLEPFTARWAKQPIILDDTGFQLKPLVIGPKQIPLVLDAVMVAQHPELFVLSAMAHGKGPKAQAISSAAQNLPTGLDDAATEFYIELVLSHLSAAARRALEVWMNPGWEPQTPFVQELRRRRLEAQHAHEAGIKEGLSDALIRVLTARGLPVSEAVLRQIHDCTDTARLNRWLTRAVTATSAEDVVATE